MLIDDGRHPHTIIAEVCGRHGYPMRKGWAAKIRRACGEDKPLDESLILETHEELFGGRSKTGSKGQRKELLRRLRTLLSEIDDGPAGLLDWQVHRITSQGEIVLTGSDNRSFDVPVGNDAVTCRFRLSYELRIPSDAVDVIRDTDPQDQDRRAAAETIDDHAAAERERLDAVVDEGIADAIQNAVDVLVRYPGDTTEAFHDAWKKALKDSSVEPLEAKSTDDGVTARRAVVARMNTAIRRLARIRGAEAVRAESGLHDYAGLFPVARSMTRRLRLFVGPTNSGKTHAAMDRLADANNGVYAAPLRLMAMEAYDRLNEERGVPCAMRTGEEYIPTPGARHTAATIEMCNLSTTIETAVVDEVQMLGDRERGWAWTQAVVGLPAAELVMTGSPDAIPWVQTLAAMTGEEVEIVEFERKTPLEPISRRVRMQEVERGDAIVAFSKKAVMENRLTLQKQGYEVATVYGALAPEVRRAEARRFREGKADVVVSTDAIGMGLNLPVHRVLLSATEKFDGTEVRRLTPAEIRQVCGRAGRYGLSEKGRAGVIAGTGSPDLVRQALEAPVHKPEDCRPWVMPPWIAIETAAGFLATDRLRPILNFLHKSILKRDEHVRSAVNEGMRGIADVVDRSDLSLRDRHAYLGIPIDERRETMWAILDDWVQRHARDRSVPAPSSRLSRIPETDAHLHEAETDVKVLTMYLWLHHKWPEVYNQGNTARAERERLNELITGALDRKVIERACRDCGTRLPKNFPHPICDACFEANRLVI